jgi:hypothetical protein
MIMGILATVAGPKLVKHLANLKDNLSVILRGHGVDGSSAWDALADIRIMGLGSKTKKPGFHIWASPSTSYTESEWEFMWADLETEFGLAGQPYVEVEHIKIGEGGRHYPHRHRVYCRVLADGKVARDSNSGARIQKIARLSELRTGEIMTRGAFDEAIIEALEKEGRQEEAQRIRDGFRLSPPPQRFVKSKEVAEARRLDDLPAKEVVRRAYEAWICSHDAPSLARALELRGLRICLGDNGRPLVVTPASSYRRLAALINSGSDNLKGAKPRMADLIARLGNFPLRPVEEVVAEVRASRADLGQIVKSDKVGRRDTSKTRNLDGGVHPAAVGKYNQIAGPVPAPFSRFSFSVLSADSASSAARSRRQAVSCQRGRCVPSQSTRGSPHPARSLAFT